MTTTTVPDVDLEQWLAGEIEKPCEAWLSKQPCAAPAEWLAYARFMFECGHSRVRFLCAACHDRATHSLDLVCRFCWQEGITNPADITFTERIC